MSVPVPQNIVHELLEEQQVVDFLLITDAEFRTTVTVTLANGTKVETKYSKPPCANEKRRASLCDGYIPVCEPFEPARELPNGIITDPWGCRALRQCIKRSKTIVHWPDRGN